MRQINANTLIIPILTVEETMLGKLLAQNEMACPWRSQDVDSALSASEPADVPGSWQSHKRMRGWGFRAGLSPWGRECDWQVCHLQNLCGGGLGLSCIHVSFHSSCASWAQPQIWRKVRGNGTIQPEEEGSQIPRWGAVISSSPLDMRRNFAQITGGPLLYFQYGENGQKHV